MAQINKSSQNKNHSKNLFLFCVTILFVLGAISFVFDILPRNVPSDDAVDSSAPTINKEEPEKLVVSNIEINENSFEKVVFVNNDLDLSESEVTIYYTNGGKKVVSILSVPELEVSDIDTTTPGVKELTVSYESFFDSIEIYVVDSEGQYSIMTNDKHLVYTDAEVLYVQNCSSNVLSRPYYTDGITKDENNKFIVNEYEDGIQVHTDGSISQTFSMQLYKGVPISSMSDGKYLSLGLNGYSESVWLCLKLWDGIPGTKLAQFVVKSGQYCNVDLSLYPDAKVWDITLMVASGAEVNAFVRPWLSLYPYGETIESGVVRDGFWNYDSPSTRFEVKPNELGIVDLSKYVGDGSNGRYVFYLKAEQLTDEKIYLIQ